MKKPFGVILSFVVVLSTILAVSVFSNEKELTINSMFVEEPLLYFETEDLGRLSEIVDLVSIEKDSSGSTMSSVFKSGAAGSKLLDLKDSIAATTGFDLTLQAMSKAVDKDAAVALYSTEGPSFVFIARIKWGAFAGPFEKMIGNGLKAERTPDDIEFHVMKVPFENGNRETEILFSRFGEFLIASTDAVLLQKTIAKARGVTTNEAWTEDLKPARAGDSETERPLAVIRQNLRALSSNPHFKRLSIEPEKPLGEYGDSVVSRIDADADTIVETRYFPHAKLHSERSLDEEINAVSNLLPQAPFRQISEASGAAKQTLELLFNRVSASENRASLTLRDLENRYYNSVSDIRVASKMIEQRKSCSESFRKAGSGTQTDGVVVSGYTLTPTTRPSPEFMRMKIVSVFGFRTEKDAGQFRERVLEAFTESTSESCVGPKPESMVEGNKMKLQLPELGLVYELTIEGRFLKVERTINEPDPSAVNKRSEIESLPTGTTELIEIEPQGLYFEFDQSLNKLPAYSAAKPDSFSAVYELMRLNKGVGRIRITKGVDTKMPIEKLKISFSKPKDPDASRPNKK
ncbi:MAG: hypothetical protein R2684_05870 [Pyrinomonadaceae bacterium]